MFEIGILKRIIASITPPTEERMQIGRDVAHLAAVIAVHYG